ncbi:hypothetical protein WICPIJ_002358 [Wickerhamomyces pijperi]|uniref:Uncharacterized protein n=1 Tax=Wickerhamomyces pijperi TaxID=599730 RepID=A0A9P8Q961_WICPI|nr:hypothetical protein WICPIJ_002358 [Wickerhamomyces pijperi]
MLVLLVRFGPLCSVVVNLLMCGDDIGDASNEFGLLNKPLVEPMFAILDGSVLEIGSLLKIDQELDCGAGPV